jgi:hypothetical protein
MELKIASRNKYQTSSLGKYPARSKLLFLYLGMHLRHVEVALLDASSISHKDHDLSITTQLQIEFGTPTIDVFIVGCDCTLCTPKPLSTSACCSRSLRRRCPHDCEALRSLSGLYGSSVPLSALPFRVVAIAESSVKRLVTEHQVDTSHQKPTVDPFNRISTASSPVPYNKPFHSLPRNYRR